MSRLAALDIYIHIFSLFVMGHEVYDRPDIEKVGGPLFPQRFFIAHLFLVVVSVAAAFTHACMHPIQSLQVAIDWLEPRWSPSLDMQTAKVRNFFMLFQSALQEFTSMSLGNAVQH